MVDGIATITLDSQHNRNALSRQLLTEIHEAIDLAEEQSARAIVLTHLGPAFCAGADLKERAEGPPDSRPDGPPARTADGHRTADDRGRERRRARRRDRADGRLRPRRRGARRVSRSPKCASAWPPRSSPCRSSGGSRRARSPRRCSPANRSTRRKPDRSGWLAMSRDDVEPTVTALCDRDPGGAPRAVAETKRLLGHVPSLPRDEAFEAMRALSDELFSRARRRQGHGRLRREAHARLGLTPRRAALRPECPENVAKSFASARFPGFFGLGGVARSSHDACSRPHPLPDRRRHRRRPLAGRGSAGRARARRGPDPPFVGRDGASARRRRASCGLDGSAWPRRLDVGA